MSSIETVVSICNKALIKVDATEISDIEENSKSARKCNQLYAYCRDALLASHPWNFAKKRAVLALDGDTPDFGFDYQYVLPSDKIEILKCVDSDDIPLEYAVEGNLLLANNGSAYVIYTYRVTDTSLFSQGFINCLILSLAKELAYSIAGSDTKVERLKVEFEKEFSRAKMANGKEKSVKVMRQNQFLLSRRTYEF